MISFKKFSLRKKIIIATIGVAALLCLISFSSVYFYLDNVLVNREVNKINSITQEHVQAIEKIYKNEQFFSKILSNRAEVKEYLLDPTENKRKILLNILSDYASLNSKFLSLYLLDKSGIAQISTDNSFTGQDYSFRDYYKEGMAGKPLVDLLLGKTSNQFGYYFSNPVFDDKQNVIGVFVSKISSQEINNTILNSEIAKESSVMLTDKFGIILVSNIQDRFLKSLDSLTLEEQNEIKLSKKFLDKEILPIQYAQAEQVVRNGESSNGLKIYDVDDGETEILNIAKLGELPFFFVSETGLESISDTILSMVLLLALIIGLAVILSFFLIYKLIQYTLKPLNKVIEFSKIISLGDLSTRVLIDSTDEFGDLATSLNKMVSDLEELHNNLEEKVVEKTKESSERLNENKDLNKALLNILEDAEESRLVLLKEKDNFKQVSDKLSLATKSAQIGVWEWDVVKNIITWDDEMYKIYGLKKEDFGGAYEAWQAGLHPDDKKAGDDAIQMALRGEKDFTPIFRVVWPNGEIRYVQAYALVERDESGKPLKMIGVNFDVTREREVDRAKTEFVSLASHQLRTPLTPIRLFSEMLLSEEVGKLNPQQKEYVSSIEQSSKRMISLVNDLLNVSRIELGRLKIDPVPTDIIVFLQDVINEVVPTCKTKGCHIVLNQPSEKFPNIDIDQTLTRQVIHNLLTNAIRYSNPEKSSLISVGVSKEGDSYIIAVKDDGIGIPKDSQVHIFEKFYRAENAVKIEGEGSGLGLYIIKMIVEESKGKIWFESPPKGESQGTVFYVSIPSVGMTKKQGDKGIIAE